MYAVERSQEAAAPFAGRRHQADEIAKSSPFQDAAFLSKINGPKRRRTFFCPIARVGDGFGLFLALHDEAKSVSCLIHTRQLASEGSPTHGLHRQDQRR
jgi:hypothetical protein